MNSTVSMGEKAPALTVAEAGKELESLLTKVTQTEIEDPVEYQGLVPGGLDDVLEIHFAVFLANLLAGGSGHQDTGGVPRKSVFDLRQINIEIAAATELSSEAPDDWIVAVARNFNREKLTVNGKTVSVTIRTITSGEILTYLNAGAYQPQAAVFSNEAWGLMAEASGIGLTILGLIS